MTVLKFPLKNQTGGAIPAAIEVMVTEELKDTFPTVETGVIDLQSVTAMAQEVAAGGGINKLKAISTIGEHHRNLAQSRTHEAGRAVVAIKKSAEDEVNVAMKEANQAKSERDKYQKFKLVQADKPKPRTFAERVKIAIIALVIIALACWGAIANAAYLQATAIASGNMALLIGLIPVLAGKLFAAAIERGVQGDHAINAIMLTSGALIFAAAITWGFTIGSEGGLNNNGAGVQVSAVDPLGLTGGGNQQTATPPVATPSITAEHRGIIRMISQIVIEVLGSFVLFFMLYELLAQYGTQFVKFSVAEPCPLYAAHDKDLATLNMRCNRLTQAIALCNEWEKSRSEAIEAFIAKAQAAFLNNFSLISIK